MVVVLSRVLARLLINCCIHSLLQSCLCIQVCRSLALFLRENLLLVKSNSREINEHWPSAASVHEQVMMELYSLLASAESVGVHNFSSYTNSHICTFFAYSATHRVLFVLSPTPASLNSICTLQLENLFFWYLRIKSSK